MGFGHHHHTSASNAVTKEMRQINTQFEKKAAKRASKYDIVPTEGNVGHVLQSSKLQW